MYSSMFQTLMGVFYYIKAVALLEDLPLEEGGAHSIESFVAEVEAGYSQVCHNFSKLLSSPKRFEYWPHFGFYTKFKGTVIIVCYLFQNAYNCWIAALLYVITLVLSAHQFWMNNRSSVSM